jgi:hypothetical protein
MLSGLEKNMGHLVYWHYIHIYIKKRPSWRIYRLTEVGAPLATKICKRSENGSVLQKHKITMTSFINSHIFSIYHEITDIYYLIFGAI